MQVSVVIPTFNRQAQVLRAIDSVLAQTVPVGEIIVVDDGSADGTAESIRSRYGSRVAVFEQQNAGVSAARNRGIREARGEWVAFLDSDDVWFPEKIQRQMEAMGAPGGPFGLCFTDNYFGGNPDLTRSLFEQTGFVNVPRIGQLMDPTTYIVAGREPFFTSSLLVRRSLLEDLDGFDEALSVREDTDLVFRLSFKAKFCFVAEPLVQIDRAPSRNGLCNLYATRDDRVFESSKRLYNKWLAMREVAGSRYERLIRKNLRLISYDSTEAKLHQFMIGAALREIVRLRNLGEGYVSIVVNLFARKVVKLRRVIRAREQNGQRKSSDPGLDQV